MAKHRIWRYLGDLRCPCHRCYGKLSVSGRGDNMVLRLTCKTTGKIWMKTLYGHWVEEEEFSKDNDDWHRSLKALADELKGR